ncbi:hypothetical protein EZV62_009154 [Acer yangbiense]|uniref:F-box domain-containing protein n=1 Tax=Acer yangbiense TaxID=1000413 RepID=A0A5C7IFV2_9ROSI|nr:hypothetical protein EZV62_009154 [Acer yangbiense]
MEDGVDDEVGGDGDRLSSLPENIIRHILSFLDSIDIVRASAVSRKWRYIWVSMPYLCVDIPYRMKFNDFVDWVLMFRNRLVDIQILRISDLNLEENYAFYRLMDVVTEFNLQELDLMIQSSDKIELPQCILNCRSLVSLKLSLYRLGTFPGLKKCMFPGFSRLKSLELCSVMFMDSLSLANFVSSCPHLENLSLDYCSFVDDNIIEITAASLKHLSFILPKGNMHFKGPIRREQTIKFGLKVACPNLVSLKVVNLRSHEFSFQEMNSLQNLLMDLDRHYNDLEVQQCCHALSKMLKGVCNVKALEVSEVFLEDLHRLHLAVDTECFAPSFNNLKSLTLHINNTDFNKHSLINILDCSPNLEALKFFLRPSGGFWWTNGNSPWKMPNRTSSCLKYHLKIVELFQVGDDKYELDLVRFFLENGHVLQKMRISWVERNLWDYSNRVYSNKGNTDEFISEVMKFPRSSPNIALTFVEPNKLDRMFINTTAMGDHAWASSSGVLPSDSSNTDTIQVKSTADSDIDVTLDAIDTKSIAVSQGQNDTVCSFTEALQKLVSKTGLKCSDQLWLFANMLFLMKDKREVFSLLDDPEDMLTWLRYEKEHIV